MKQKLLLALAAFLFGIIYQANAQGGTLPLNSSVGGTLAMNGTDTWQLTTTGDGLIHLTFQETGGNSVDMYATLYDNNGTTVLSGPIEAYMNHSTVTLTVDGLATGTYYVKITPFNSTSSGPYTLSDSAYTSPVANDVEPNGTRATAVTIARNSSKTGHAGYYYNNQRDTADWYKVTTNADGLLHVTLSSLRTSGPYSNNSLDMLVYLYDNDGTTQLGYTEVFNGYNPATGSFTVDGLAAGTYYIKVQNYTSTEFASYTLSDSLYTSPVANDAEPNGSRATALTIARNSSTTGHAGFYYNHQRDTADWYKVTTNSNGLLRVTLSSLRTSGPYSNNNLDMFVYLYDNDGTTQLGTTEVFNGYNPATGSFNVDGLAAGTYYIKVTDYLPDTRFASYTLSDSLFTPSVANDVEPNGTPATAITFPENSTKTGQVGYYYNNYRDTADWYKVTTTQDGLLRIRLTTSRTNNTYSNNSLDLLVYVYDINGTTQLGYKEIFNGYNPTTDSFGIDRLAAGTYYIKVQNYTSTEFSDYAISNSVLTYNANDNEPNDNPYQATTIPANDSATGHVGFYFNGGVKQDYTDWFKVNYTGSGNLKFNFNMLRHLGDNALGDVFFRVYKDTLAAPIFSQEYYATLQFNTINLASLTQGYYWIKVLPYNSNPAYFTAYSITDSFTQVGPKLTASYDTLALACSSNNKITIKATKSGSTTVQLYRYGVAYGSPVVTTRTATFKNLPIGSYYATGVADGASGGIMGTSKTVNLIPMPTNPNTTAIGSAQATLNWTTVSCARYYSVQYRVHGTLPWSLKKTTGNVGSYLLTGLTNATMYDWEVAAVDTLNGIKATSIYTDSVVFTTAATPFATAAGNSSLSNKQNNGNGNGGSDLQVFPNPASSKFRLQFTGINTNGNMVATLKDINGRTVWQAANVNSAVLKSGMDVDISKLPNGIYYLQLTDANKNTITKKVIVSR